MVCRTIDRVQLDMLKELNFFIVFFIDKTGAKAIRMKCEFHYKLNLLTMNSQILKYWKRRETKYLKILKASLLSNRYITNEE